MPKPKLFDGVATALVTPFRDGAPDLTSLKRLVRYQIDRGADALVIAGTTGEAPTLTALEKLRCVSAAAEAAEGRVPIIAGTATNDTTYSVRLSRLASREGADAILAVTPYYNRPTPEGLIRHFLTLAEEAGKPILLYNVPSRTGSDLPDAVYEALAGHPAVAGVKEASGSVSRVSVLIERYRDRLPVYSGNDDITLPILAVGGAGVVSVVSNLFPTEVHELCRQWAAGNREEAFRLHRMLFPLARALFAEPNPIPVKAAMVELGFCSSELRLPLTPACEETVRRLRDAMAGIMGE